MNKDDNIIWKIESQKRDKKEKLMDVKGQTDKVSYGADVKFS